MLEKLGGDKKRYRQALEFGCGPVIIHALPLTRFVDDLHLADYLPDNLRQIQLWLDDDDDAFDWDPFIQDVMVMEQQAIQLEERKAQLRAKVTNLRHGDIRRSVPLGNETRYDLVTSFFCVEAVANDLVQWQEYMANLASLVAPGGVLVLAAMRNCKAYQVLNHLFSSCPVDETNLAALLPKLGFDATTIKIKSVPIRTWAEHGFAGICLVWAEKPGNL